MRSAGRAPAAARIVAALLGAAAFLLPAGGASAAPRNADGDGIRLSLDGIRFSESPTGSLFPSSYRVVPGDRLTASLWIRNQSRVEARVGLGISDVAGEAVLLRAATLTPSAGGAPLRLADAAESGCVDTSLPALLGPGRTIRIELVLDVSPELRQSAGQNASFDFAVRTALHESGAPASASTCSSGSGAGGFSPIAGYSLPTMASTGAAVAAPLALGVGAAALGTALALGGRRRKDSKRP